MRRERAATYQIDMGRDQNVMIFVVYGFTGHSGEARLGTNAIIDAIRAEVDRGTYLPTVIMVDFNAEPESIEAVQEMIDEEAWTEIGSNAHWWGRPRKQMTCRARANARESRIDGFLVNKEAFPLIQDFRVEKDEMIPTHSCVGIVLSRSASTETLKFARTLPCLKKLFEQQLQDILAAACGGGDKTVDRQNPLTGEHDNSMEAKSKQEQEEKSEQKRQAATKKEEKAKLHECMDREIDKRKLTLEAYRQMQDVDGMWMMISTTVERAWLT